MDSTSDINGQAMLAVVLSDGETWTELDGCFVAVVDGDWEYGDPSDYLVPVALFTSEPEPGDLQVQLPSGRCIGIRTQCE